jgi:hypothetical protein
MTTPEPFHEAPLRLATLDHSFFSKFVLICIHGTPQPLQILYCSIYLLHRAGLMPAREITSR